MLFLFLSLSHSLSPSLSPSLSSPPAPPLPHSSPFPPPFSLSLSYSLSRSLALSLFQLHWLAQPDAGRRPPEHQGHRQPLRFLPNPLTGFSTAMLRNNWALTLGSQPKIGLLNPIAWHSLVLPFATPLLLFFHCCCQCPVGLRNHPAHPTEKDTRLAEPNQRVGPGGGGWGKAV